MPKEKPGNHHVVATLGDKTTLHSEYTELSQAQHGAEEANKRAKDLGIKTVYKAVEGQYPFV